MIFLKLSHSGEIVPQHWIRLRNFFPFFSFLQHPQESGYDSTVFVQSLEVENINLGTLKQNKNKYEDSISSHGHTSQKSFSLVSAKIVLNEALSICRTI